MQFPRPLPSALPVSLSLMAVSFCPKHMALGAAGRAWAKAGEPRRRWVMLGPPLPCFPDKETETQRAKSHGCARAEIRIQRTRPCGAWGFELFSTRDPLPINETQAPDLPAGPHLPIKPTPYSSHTGPDSFLPQVLCKICCL